MVKRSTPQKAIDDRAFPVRLKVLVPEFGFGNVLVDIEVWMRNEVGSGNYAQHGGETIGGGHAVAFYFRSLRDAQRFVDAFPLIELADGTISAAYSSPALPFGRDPRC